MIRHGILIQSGLQALSSCILAWWVASRYKDFLFTNKDQISASIPATKPFFISYLPQVFGSLTTLPSHISQDSRQRTQRRSNHTIITTANHHDHEMLTFEKALGAERSGTSSMMSRTDESRKDSEEEECIRVTQSVRFAKHELWRLLTIDCNLRCLGMAFSPRSLVFLTAWSSGYRN